MLWAVWQWYHPFVSEFRRRLGLAPTGAIGAYRALASAPLIGAYSPHVVHPPRDWPPSAHVTGYLYLNPLSDWQPPDELLAFLDDGDPPVYVGFGSMAGREPERMAEIVLGALARSGQRGLLLSGWGGMRALAVPATVFVADAVPHAWLFPRVAAVVHHGGAGTTGEGLRAGRPTVVVPHILDQPFWGARVRALGVGPEPLPRRKLTADALADAITAACIDRGMRERAEALGAAIRAEDGPGAAVAVVGEHVGPP